MQKKSYLASLLVLACCAMLIIPNSAFPQANILVDLELSLLIDISGSVDASEFTLQRDGYRNAFNNIALWNAINQGVYKQIAVNYIYWSGQSQQYLWVDWMLINSYAASQAFAAAIGTGRPSPYNLTAPGSAINYTYPRFWNNIYDGTRQVIDISGDGTQNDGFTTYIARNNALASGVDAINGLAIGNQTILNWYNTNIVGGINSFGMLVTNFNDFGAAIDDKLIREIKPIPEPGTFLLLGTGLLGIAAIRYRRSKK